MLFQTDKSNFISLSYKYDHFEIVVTFQLMAESFNKMSSIVVGFKEVQYNYSAHHSAHLFIIAICRDSQKQRKQPDIFFLIFM